jgi:hypothetical protein
MKKENLCELVSLESTLRSARRIPIVAAGTTGHEAPESSGVYAVWERSTGKVIYVGESSNLRHRIGDFLKPKKHRVWSILSGIPDALTVDAEKLEVSWITDFIGRRELEDFLNIRWLDKKPKRLPYADADEMKKEPNRVAGGN